MSIFAGGDSQSQRATSRFFAVYEQWLFCRSEKLLWLPHEYQPKVVAVTEDTVAMVIPSGRLVVMRFDFESANPWE
jgi:hypothetical protein